LAFQPKRELGGADEIFALAFRGRRGVNEGIEVVGAVEGHDGANVGKGGDYSGHPGTEGTSIYKSPVPLIKVMFK